MCKQKWYMSSTKISGENSKRRWMRPLATLPFGSQQTHGFATLRCKRKKWTNNIVPNGGLKKKWVALVEAKNELVGGWTNPSEKICLSKWVHLPQVSGWKFQKSLSCHHLDEGCGVVASRFANLFLVAPTPAVSKPRLETHQPSSFLSLSNGGGGGAVFGGFLSEGHNR